MNRPISHSEVVWLRDYMSDIAAREELKRLRRDEAFVRVEPPVTLREALWLLAGALLAIVAGLVLYAVQVS